MTRAAPLDQGPQFSCNAGDRVCIIGKNGKGKTTLLKLLAGKLGPGRARSSTIPASTRGFYEQTNIQSLIDSRTVEEDPLRRTRTWTASWPATSAAP